MNIVRRTETEVEVNFGRQTNYIINLKGEVISTNYRSNMGFSKKLTPHKDKNGYPYVNIYFPNKVKKIKIHRLVGLTLIPNPHGLPQLNHKDENKENNYVENLEWCTNYYNHEYGTAKLRIAEKISVAVDQYSLSGKFIRTWRSMSEASRELGLSLKSISSCCRMRSYQHGGYKWEYNDKTHPVFSEKPEGRFKQYKYSNPHIVDGKLCTPVRQLSLDGQLVKEWDNIADTKKYGFCPAHIMGCCMHKPQYVTHKKFRWEFADTTATPSEIAG